MTEATSPGETGETHEVNHSGDISGTRGAAADGRWAARLMNGVWLLTSGLIMLVMGPATAIPPPASAGYLLYHQSGFCIPNASRANAKTGDEPHRFRPRVTRDAVFPMSAAPHPVAGSEPAS
jgi:hypothetical protein